MSCRPAGNQRGLRRGVTKCKSLVMFYLLTKEQTNPGRLGCSCRHQHLLCLVSEVQHCFLFSPARCHTPVSEQEPGSSWPLLMPRHCSWWPITACACQHFLKERRSLSSFMWGRGRKPLSALYPLMGVKQRKCGKTYEYETMAGCPLPHNTAHRATPPALDAECTRFGKAGRTEATEASLHSDAVSPFLGHSAAAGTAKAAHTWQRSSQNPFALLLPKVLPPAHFLCLPVVSGGKEKKEEQQGANITCYFQRWHSTAAGITRHVLVMLLSTRTGQWHAEKPQLLGVRRLQLDMFILTKYLTCTLQPSASSPCCPSSGPAGSLSGRRLMERMESTHFHHSEASYQLFEDLPRSSVILFSELRNGCWWCLPTIGSRHWWVL